jgi:two-component system nitrogen regulation response regulator GlnG
MAKRNVLIVDDEKSILAALRMVLGGRYTVLTAETASEALGFVRERAPDLIFLDIGLPDASGMDLLTQLKRLAPASIIIMMTASEDTETVTTAHELGALDYLVKPIDAEVLKAVIQNAFQKEGPELAALATVPD